MLNQNGILLKLIFEHDIPLERLDQSPEERRKATESLSLEDFMRPMPVFSRFYLTGTILGDESRFGLNTMPMCDQILQSIGLAINRDRFVTQQSTFSDFIEAVNSIQIGEAVTIPISGSIDEVTPAAPARGTGEPEVVAALHELLKSKSIIVYKETAHHGWDLHIYSTTNIYPSLFSGFKPFIADDVRFFSMNGKRIRSERLFYFETWSLDRPPHGIEEVTALTTI